MEYLMGIRRLRPMGALAATAALVATGGIAASTAVAASPACDTRVNNTFAKLLECVELEGVREHQAAFQAIADANNGTRVSGTPGYDESVDYVVERLQAAGWRTTVQDFQFQTFLEFSPAVVQRISPPPAGPVAATAMDYSGSGDVTAAVSRPADAGSGNEGCEAADFAGFAAGHIALIQRGGCTFAIKATNAYNAGASAVIIWNNAAGALNGTLGADFTLDIGVVQTTQAIGAELAAGVPGLTMRVKTDTFRGIATTSNVLAELPGKNKNNVVMSGAHLDSVNEGPGINDNGSGSAALIEIAEQLGKVKPQNTVRFAWWGAEESGLVGSIHYVNTLPQAELDKIAVYLNYDMFGSPNHVFFIYDGDDSDGVGAGAGPDGSAQIEKTYEAFFESRGIPYKGTDFSGRSDYGPFIAVGIPSGGLFTGAEGIKTAEEAAIWGGTAGQQYDPCYHLVCDTFDNVNLTALDVNSDAAAYAALQYAMSTQLINGEKSKGNFRPRGDDHDHAMAS
jgi:aminopeptidase Y